MSYSSAKTTPPRYRIYCKGQDSGIASSTLRSLEASNSVTSSIVGSSMRLSALSLSVPMTPATIPTTEEAGVAATRMQAAARGRQARTHVQRQQQRAQASKVEHDLMLKRGGSDLGRLTNVDSMRAAIKKASGDGSFVIDPRSSEWTHWWDLVVVILLVVVLFMTPYEVAFLEPGLVEPTAVALFVVNRLFDLVFFLDMVSPRRPASNFAGCSDHLPHPIHRAGDQLQQVLSARREARPPLGQGSA